MTKQIELVLEDNRVVAKMNNEVLFELTSVNRSIDIESLYKKLDISADDKIENCILELKKDEKDVLDNIYDNTKLFLDDLIKKINKVISEFDAKEESNLLLNQ